MELRRRDESLGGLQELPGRFGMTSHPQAELPSVAAAPPAAPAAPEGREAGDDIVAREPIPAARQLDDGPGAARPSARGPQWTGVGSMPGSKLWRELRADAAAGCWAAPELQEQNSGVAVGCQGDPSGQPANPSGCPCAECWRGRVPTKLMPLLMRPVQVDAADVSSVSWAKARMGRQTARLSGLLGSVVCCEGLGPGLGSRAFVPSKSTCL